MDWLFQLGKMRANPKDRIDHIQRFVQHFFEIVAA
jgi:hypothetical protein